MVLIYSFKRVMLRCSDLLLTLTAVLRIFLILLIAQSSVFAQRIHKFEQLNVTDGLSQNFVQTILCDEKGFLWFGTWDGLNRYDGRRFTVFKVNPNQKNSLTNNRITDLWQDKQNTLWVKSNDGYIHYFVESTQEFFTYPKYLKSIEETNSTIACFVETDNEEVFLGSTNSGIYYLKYDENTDRYIEHQFVKGGKNTLSDNSISFMTKAQDNLWIGTAHGLNHVTIADLNKTSPTFSSRWENNHFTVGFDMGSILLFGTKGAGIKTFDTESGQFDNDPSLFKNLSQKTITIINQPSKDKVLIGTASSGLFVYDLKTKSLQNHFLAGNEIKKIYQDSFKKLWVNTQDFGIYSIDSAFTKIRQYDLVPAEIRSTLDDERQFIYEDSKKNFWIALHGGGLAHFNRDLEEFEFYRHVLNDNTTISSDNVYCITEDHNGLLWVGTGHTNGGVNKIYTSSEAFQRIRLEENGTTEIENVVRSILVDTNGYTWVGTKDGSIHVLDKNYTIVRKITDIPLVNNGWHPSQNAYTMLQDKDGYLWFGTKGGGVFVSDLPLNKMSKNYGNIRFINYEHNPKDKFSISSNIIYSIFQDSDDRIWIGSYRGGLNLVTSRDGSKLNCLNFMPSNSGLSSDKVRHITEDHSKRLWIATAFGLSYIDLKTLKNNLPKIKSELYDPRFATSLSYNDVIHVFEDKKQHVWIGTSGGGVNKLHTVKRDSMRFTHLTTKEGLVNDDVYAILEDRSGNLWFSTDNGISRYNVETGTFDNFDESNNLSTSVFNENTCALATDGNLLFGTNDGLLIINPSLIEKDNFMPNIVFTHFQIFNKDIDIKDPNSPIKKDIETLDEIELKHFQSSFSIEYAALSFYAPTKNRYAFMLENFDANWNEVGNQNKATYTNLPPGTYTFKVKAANWNGDWSDQIRSIKITILNPWWATTGMYILYAVILLIIFELLRRAYVRYHTMQNDLKVEKRVSDIKLQFFTNISHEIRTPLTLILGPIHDIMEIKSVPAIILKKLHLVEKNGKRMLRLTNQLLDFRKVQQQKMNLKVYKTELISFLQSIIENFNLVAEHKNVAIEFITHVDSLHVWVDPNKFDSVIFNILSNALKFSPKDSKITIAVNSIENSFIDISISDQGTGIPKERMSLIFQRFSPLSEDNEEFGSSGIGLAFSYQLMKLHHGDIVAKSEINKGSVFTIRLLQGASHFTAEEIQPEADDSLHLVKHKEVIEDNEEILSTPPQETPGEKNHILIVEDNMEIISYLRDGLQTEYTIATATNGKEALEYIANQQPDILITDIMMPVMNGIELTKHLKEAIETCHIPVIMLTAKSSMEDQIEGIEYGAEAYILKPFNMAYVHAVISNLIKQRHITYKHYVRNKNIETSGLKITSKDEKFLNDITRLIMDNYSDPEFNIEKLAESSYVSRTVFYNKIKSLTGLTPIDFLRQKRLHIAAQLILESDYNVSEIATITGFNDVKNFSKRFKELYKLTPSQYKLEGKDKVSY